MTYEYACSACGHEWEVEQKISEDPVRKCPKCHKLQAKRQISRGAGFILKGGGWYADGYGSSSGGSKSSGSASAPAEPTSSDTKSDSKSDGKADGKTESKPPSAAKGKTAAA